MIFNKKKINKIILNNRIVISPMCQYSAIDGCPTRWHYKHLMHLSSVGAGMLILEATAVEKNGKISNADLCLYNSKHEKKITKLVQFLKKHSDTKLGIQISHAGRKGSSFIPWLKPNSPLVGKKSWITYAPSSEPRAKNWPTPNELSITEIKKIINKFKNTAIKAQRSKFDCIEIHMAHGYLLHQFFSPISNKRVDNYGGSLENRSRLLVQITREIRKVWSKNKILGARITGTDHLKGGIQIKDAIYLAKKLKAEGIDYISVSSGGIIPKTNMKQSQAFRAKMAYQIRKEVNINTTTSGMITDYKIANNLIKQKKIDFITIARVIVKNPAWIYQFANKTNNLNIIPNPYKRIFSKK